MRFVPTKRQHSRSWFARFISSFRFPFNCIQIKQNLCFVWVEGQVLRDSYRVLLRPRILSTAKYNFVSLEDVDFTGWSSRDDAVWHVRRLVQCGELRAAWSRSVYCRPRQPVAPLASATAPTRRVVSTDTEQRYRHHGEQRQWSTIPTLLGHGQWYKNKAQ